MIKKEILAQLILDFKEEKFSKLLRRNLDIKLPLPLKRAVVIMGPRRSGKTHYLYLLIEKLFNQKISKDRIVYVNFENPKLIGMDANDLTKLVEVYYEIYPANSGKKTFFFFDEIQNIPNWEIFVRHLLDKKNIQVVLSGSSSKLLSAEIATSLRGRTISYLMLPFNFKEILSANNIDLKQYFSSKTQAKINRSLDRYLDYGGYPEILLYPEAREKIMAEIIEVTIFMDLIERHKIRNTKVIKLMFQYLIKAKEFSVHQFFNFLKSLNIKVSKNSLYNYLEYFNDAFIFFSLRKFSYSLKEAEQSIPKIYTADNGLIESIFSGNKGKKFENLVFLGLLNKGLIINKNIFYYKMAGGEVDFAVVKNQKVRQLIQACYDMSDYRTKNREIKSLLKAGADLSCNNLLVITRDEEGEEKIKNKTIKYTPLWKWLLE